MLCPFVKRAVIKVFKKTPTFCYKQSTSSFSTQLSALTARQSDQQDTPVILDNGLLLPPIGMYKVPKVMSFEPIPLPPHLEPRRDKNSRHHKKDSGVFFFTPIQFGGKTGDPNMVAFKWVEGDVAEVCLTIFNPLPTEVKIVNLALLHEVGGSDVAGFILVTNQLSLTRHTVV